MDVGATIRVHADLVLQTVDIPELGCGCVRVEQIVDAKTGQPPLAKVVVHIEVQLTIALSIDLSLRGGCVGARRGDIGEIVDGSGIDTWP